MSEKEHGINILAISPPEFEKNLLSDSQRMSSINSEMPYALMATLSHTFELVRDGILRVLNWSSPEGIRESVFLMHFWNESREILREKIRHIQPDVVFIGTFAMNFRGAIESAKMIRELSPRTLIVLGGRHIGETIWADIGGDMRLIGVQDHAIANPLSLMQEEFIPGVFDIVVAHEGRAVIPRILEHLQDRKCLTDFCPRDIVHDIGFLEDVPGYWVAGKVDQDELSYVYPERYIPSIATHDLSPYCFAGSDDVHFPVFSKSDWTAHVHSDSRGISGNSCTQSCSFCSESQAKQKVRSPHVVDASDTLFRRFREIVAVGGNKKTSIFVEDSILCGGNLAAMERFCDLMEGADRERLPQEWGCQCTVPMILHERGHTIIKRLAQVGLTYVYFGLENANQDIAITINKSKNSRNWLLEAETAIANLAEMGLKVGTSNIFCMGESQQDRMNQLGWIETMQCKYSGNPCVYSLNMQTVHPGEWTSGYTGPKYDYTEWALDESDPRTPMIQKIFGEAAVRYMRYPSELPSLSELQEIYHFLRKLTNQV